MNVQLQLKKREDGSSDGVPQAHTLRHAVLACGDANEFVEVQRVEGRVGNGSDEPGIRRKREPGNLREKCRCFQYSDETAPEFSSAHIPPIS